MLSMFRGITAVAVSSMVVLGAPIAAQAASQQERSASEAATQSQDNGQVSASQHSSAMAGYR